MKGLGRNYGLYISLGVLALAIVGSGFFYKREADKAKRLQADVAKWREQLNALWIEDPTEEHRQFLGKQKVQIEEDFKDIVRQALRWDYVPEQMDGLRFQGNMLTTIREVQYAARANQIVIASKAKNLGFDEYATVPPPDEEVPQLQKEFAAANDIVRLLIASDVYSIDRMSRRDEALMEEGRSTARARIAGEISTIAMRKKTKYDFYDTVPFRVIFSCTYPSLAFFQKSLITPKKVVVGGQRLPQSFLVVNDLRFKVKPMEGEREKVMGVALEKVRTSTWAVAGVRSPLVPDFPEDLPDAHRIWEKDKEGALRFFAQWRTWLPEQKEIYRLEQQLFQQIPREDKEKLAARRDRLLKELEYRKLEGRPPQYSIIEVNMLIDFVNFYEEPQGSRKALAAELEPEPAKPGTPASSLLTAGR